MKPIARSEKPARVMVKHGYSSPFEPIKEVGPKLGTPVFGELVIFLRAKCSPNRSKRGIGKMTDERWKQDMEARLGRALTDGENTAR